MPLVAHSELPTFERLRAAGTEVLGVERALHQDIRELHIGLLNLMPDAALQATERQFMRLVGECNRIVQFYVHPFTVQGLARGPEAAAHVARYYEPFEKLRQEGLDALIISGANPSVSDIEGEPFWDGLVEVMDWARTQVCSTMMSCLATHAALHRYHGIERRRGARKQWGVYAHRVRDFDHPLVADINTRFDTCHSRFYGIDAAAMRAAGLRVLVESEEAGVLLATSPDGLRFVYLQGHPEYDINSLLKEYKREVLRAVAGERDDYPEFPDHYFGPQARALLEAYRGEVARSLANAAPLAPFPEARVQRLVDNTWTDTGKAIFNNWLGLVYQLTDPRRDVPLMPGVDPQDPLGLLGGPSGTRR